MKVSERDIKEDIRKAVYGKKRGVFILDIIDNGVIVLKEEAHLFFMDKQPHTGLFLPGYAENTISSRV